MCRDYIITPNVVSPDLAVSEIIDMHIGVSDEAIEKERQESDIPVSPDYCESICIYRAISENLIEYDAFLVHGACIQYEGDAYLFLAKSGTGKSTHISLWKKVLIGDKMLR